DWVTADEISVDDEALRRGDDLGKKAMVLGSQFACLGFEMVRLDDDNGFLIQEGTATTLLQGSIFVHRLNTFKHMLKEGAVYKLIILQMWLTPASLKLDQITWDDHDSLLEKTVANEICESGDNNLGDDTPGASCVSCICSKNHKLSATDQATCSGGFYLLKQQELRKTQSGAQQRSHMFQQQRGSLRRNTKHKC
ncbi:hypothetical protein HID58_024652, partial [Brassica napus]